MASKKYNALGLMSGSSLDGLDIAFCEFEVETNKDSPEAFFIQNWKLIQSETLPFSQKWKDRLIHLPAQNALIFAQTDIYFGYYMGELVNDFLKRYKLQPDFIASHGHTVFHLPFKKVTVQIGAGGALAAVTKNDVICDFRSQDLAIDGEGAPIAPIADKLLFSGHDFYLNIGGIANITCAAKEKYIAFDIGGANQILNAISNEIDLEYDEDGAIAAQGEVDEALFDHLNSLDYFQIPYPKSLANQWVLKKQVEPCLLAECPIEDKMRTACEQLAYQTARAIYYVLEKEKIQKKKYSIIVTGGGAMNKFLVECLRNHCKSIGDFDWLIPDESIIQFKEAVLMALMGVLRMENIPNCLSSVTGAQYDTIGGAIYKSV